MGNQQSTAAAMARTAGLDPKIFRQALRSAALPWHQHGSRWIVGKDSPEHRDMRRVLTSLLRGKT